MPDPSLPPRVALTSSVAPARRLLGQEADAERLAARLEDGVLGVGVLREQPRQRRRRPQRPVGVGAAGKRVARAATLLSHANAIPTARTR